MRLLVIVLLVTLIFLSTGCTSTQGRVVKIFQKQEEGGWRAGTAAVIGEDRVITAYHVVDVSDEAIVNAGVIFKNWVRFRIETELDSTREPIVILKTKDYKFRKRHTFKIGHGLPYKVVTRRGTFLWEEYKARQGDSGSPVLNNMDELIGVVYGHTTDEKHTTIYLPINPL